MEKTYFISFEGIDGSGKDTQLFELAKQIKEDDNIPFGNKYSHIWITRNPTKITKPGREISELIRSQDVDGQTASRLYIRDRIEHSKIVRKMLEHTHVLSSRYDISTLIYQVAQGEDFEELYQMHNFEDNTHGCVIPNYTIIFKIPAEVSFKRISSRGEAQECFEKIEFQQKLAEIQDEIIEKLRQRGRKIIEVNANQPIKEVTKEMLFKLNEEING